MGDAERDRDPQRERTRGMDVEMSELEGWEEIFLRVEFLRAGEEGF